MTPIIESVRALLLNTSPDGKILISVIWCLGILFISYIMRYSCINISCQSKEMQIIILNFPDLKSLNQDEQTGHLF